MTLSGFSLGEIIVQKENAQSSWQPLAVSKSEVALFSVSVPLPRPAFAVGLG